MNAKVLCKFVLVAIVLVCTLIPLSGSDGVSRGPAVFGIEDNRVRIEQECMQRLSRIPTTREVLSEEEATAVRVLGVQRNRGRKVLEVLVGLIRMRSDRSKATRPEVRTRPDIDWTVHLLTEYPVAEALVEIGLPSVRNICEVLDAKEVEVPKEVRKLYAGIIVEVLGARHAHQFMEVESQAVGGAKPRYDAIIREIDEYCATLQAKQPEVRILLPDGNTANIKMGEGPATRPAGKPW